MTAAERQRRYRQRQTAGITVYPVPADDGIIGRLIDCGFLDANESTDQQSVALGILRAAKRAIRGWRNEEGSA